MNRKESKSVQFHNAHEQHHKDGFAKSEDPFYVLRNKDCVLYKFMVRQLELLRPLLKEKNSWLTIGDYTGFEAKYFAEQDQRATASDLSDVYLKVAKEQNLIEHYAKVNAEGIDFEENQFDYLCCKESFHHFPRAYLGLYEMLRVAKKGIVLIEPVDILSKMPLLLFLKNISDRINPYFINKIWKNRFSWEGVGNYVFKISIREIEKIAMGIGLPCIAYKEINIQLKTVPTKWGNLMQVPFDKKLYKKLKRRLAIWNFICKLRIIPYNTLCAIVFKERPSQELLKELKQNKFRVIELPTNPYSSRL
ncbi:MAG: class I SAM-dependent methyltransferase [Marinilabiliaceae bacterium]|nr:class I SAM-dependent methyltransferase [Marinilabiliaceae bacterium]